MEIKNPRILLKVLLIVIILSFPIQACSPPAPDSERPSEIEQSESEQPPERGEEARDDMEHPPDEPPAVEEIQPESGSTLRWIDNSLLVYIPPGEFIMGNGGEDSPEHPVYLDGFWIYRTEVTYRMYLSCMERGICTPPATDPSLPDNLLDPLLTDLPVIGLRWDQAAQYCESVGGSLPTEAQWERTARGTNGGPFPWGTGEPSCELMNFNECRGETSPVAEYVLGASQEDVLDMAGNVYEWVNDWYQEDYYYQEYFDNPRGPDFGEFRSVRGSAFRTSPDEVESAMRNYLGPDEYQNDLGFRCVVGNAQTFAPPCAILAHAPEAEESENPDAGPGGSAACVVPQPTITYYPHCFQGQSNIDISWEPADADVNYSISGSAWCTPFDVDTLACSGDAGAFVKIEVCKSCPPPSVQLGVPGSCDPPYVFDTTAGYCRYGGPAIPGRVRCAPGYSYSDDESCCVRETGTPLDFPVCPVGGVFDSASLICWFTLPSTGDKKCDTLTVQFSDCSKPGGSGQGSSQPTPDPCSTYSTNAECRVHKDKCYWDYGVGACLSIP
jgi:formylglycine-generating enzyme required for sulfatase activity